MKRPSRRNQIIIVLFAALLVVVDFVFGPYIQFPVFFVLPVMLAAWYCGAMLAVGLALALGLARFLCHWYWSFPMDFMPAIVNNVLRVIALLMVGYGTAFVSKTIRDLRKRVSVLEQQLPVCKDCGLIQTANGEWVPVESLEVKSEYAHTSCPHCQDKRYGSIN
jgi:hypothetical protein